ncbi:hypothetical protein LCGC14_2336440 [marine sediment metagenome]|uniref:Uncharacterized protein n=1 Tax=marine sediment metagenome TaxID=412755 RepID=A0A0F9F8D9_9ZZZZ
MIWSTKEQSEFTWDVATLYSTAVYYLNNRVLEDNEKDRLNDLTDGLEKSLRNYDLSVAQGRNNEEGVKND